MSNRQIALPQTKGVETRGALAAPNQTVSRDTWLGVDPSEVEALPNPNPNPNSNPNTNTNTDTDTYSSEEEALLRLADPNPNPNSKPNPNPNQVEALLRLAELQASPERARSAAHTVNALRQP